MRLASWQALICDVGVIEDYLCIAPSMFAEMSKVGCRLYIPDIMARQLAKSGVMTSEGVAISELETSVECLVDRQASDGLSFLETAYLASAINHSLACVSNDPRFRSECRRKTITVFWGVELMLSLTQKRVLTRANAMSFARKMSKLGPQNDGDALRSLRTILRKT